MKIHQVFRLLMVMILISSCSNDDDSSTISADIDESLITGTWLLTSSIDEDGVEYVEEGDCDYLFIITENFFTDREYFETSEGCVGFEDIGPYPYEIIDGALVVEFTDEDNYFETYEILELTNTRLKTYLEYDDEGETYTETDTFVRQ